MIKKLFQKTTYDTLLSSGMYDHFFKDFILGFIFKIGRTPAVIKLLKSRVSITINDNLDRLTVSEIFGWEIYRTNRLENYSVVVDIGANIGCASLYFSNNCENLRTIIAFEPDPRAFSTLSENLKLCPENIEVVAHKKAISSYDGTTELLRAQSSRYNSIKSLDKFPSFDSIMVETFSFSSLISLIREYDPDETLIKIDIEGMESELLAAIFDAGYLGDIIVEGDMIPSDLGAYEMHWNKFSDVYFFGLAAN
jgi:FkbM family methyltransferase